jgi:PKD repeat protein
MPIFQKVFFGIFFLLLLVFISTTGGDISADAISISQSICPSGEENYLSCGVPEDIVPSVMATGGIRESVIGIINYLLGFLGLVLVIVIIWAGVLMIFSGGDEENVTKGRKIILYAIIGLIIILLSYTIVNFLANITSKTPSSPLPSTSQSGSPNPSNSFSPNPSESPNPSQTTSPDINQLLQKIRDIEAMIQKLADGSITQEQIKKLQEEINELYNSSPKTIELERQIAQILKKFEELKNDPDNTALAKQIQELIKEFLTNVQKFPTIKAIIKAIPSEREVPFTVHLSAYDSKISDSSILLKNDFYSWKVMDPDGNTSELGTGPEKTFLIEKPGNYLFSLTIHVTGKDGETLTNDGHASIQIRGTPKNESVTFTINNEEMQDPYTFTLDEAKAGLIFSPELKNVYNENAYTRFVWNFGDSSSIEKNSKESVTHAYGSIGKKVVTIDVYDTNGKKISKKTSILIADIVAKFSLSKKSANIGDEITFNASLSSSIGSDIVEYKWEILDPNKTKKEYFEKIFTESFSTPGPYTIKLTITDEEGKTINQVQNFSIGALPPKAAFSFSVEKPSDPAKISFDASLTKDETSTALKYSWDFDGDGKFEITNSSSPITEYTFSEVRRYTTKLVVENGFGEKSETIRTIEIPSTLSVSFTPSTIVAFPGEEITFTASSNQGKVYQWDFGDGKKEYSEEKTIQHTFTEKGEYRIKLTVQSEENKENSVWNKIYVGEKDSPIAVPQVFLNNQEVSLTENLCGNGKDGIRIYRSTNVRFSGEGSINRDGTKVFLDYEWTFPEGQKQRIKDVSRRFTELSELGQCFSVILSAQDRASGKKATAVPIYVFVDNALPTMQNFVVRKPKGNITPIGVPLEVVGAIDPDGKIVEYKWWATREGNTDKIDIHTTSEPYTVITLPIYGPSKQTNRYIFHVEIRDSDGAKINNEDLFGESIFVDAINDDNTPIEVELSTDKISLDAGDTVTFRAVARTGSGGAIPDAIYKWDFNGDNIYDNLTSGSIASYKYEIAGKYTARLKVEYRGLITSATKDITVDRITKLPVAAFIASIKGDTIFFDAKNSQHDTSIPENTLTYEWDFDTNVDSNGDGESNNDVDATGVSVSHKYPLGTQSISVGLRVTDKRNEHDEIIRKINFNAISGIISEWGSTTNPNTGDNTGLLRRLYTTLRIMADIPMTKMTLVASQKSFRAGESIDIYCITENADGTAYEGPLFYEVLEGSGVISPTEVKSIAGRGVSTLTSMEAGTVVLQVSAPDAIFGNISETFIFSVVP